MQTRRGARVLAMGLAGALLLGACGSDVRPSASPSAAAVGGGWERIPAIVAQVEPSVVSIVSTGGEGSGVVWSADGVIVTNNHVVEGVEQVIVVFADGERSDAEVLATDPLSDLAIVRAARQSLPAATFAGAIPPVGSLAIALGNPLGFENSATAGIISGTN